MALLPLVALPLLLRLIPWRPGDRWSTPVELGLAALCGYAVVALCNVWLIRYHLYGDPLTGSDFTEYCTATAAIRDDKLHVFSHNRSLLAAWPSAKLSEELGVIDGLAYSALWFTGVIGAGLYFWGRAIHSRLSGVATALLFGAVGPLVLLPRTLSYYPVTISIFVSSAAGAALALRYRTWPALLVGGIGAGLAFLADVRGLFWALPALGLSLLACVPLEWRVPKAWARLPLRLALVLLPIAASYVAGGRAFQETNWTLEHQAFGLVQDRYVEMGRPISPPKFKTDYLWGHSSPLQIPATLKTLTEIRAQVPAEVVMHPETVHGRRAHVQPWLPVLGGALLIAAASLWRRPWQLAALLGTLVPFAVVLRSAADILIHPRFLQTPMAAFPLPLGVALAALVLGAAGAPEVAAEAATEGGAEGPPLEGRWRWRRWARPVAASALVVVLLLGVVPSWLSPVAGWRYPWTSSESVGRMIRGVANKQPLERGGDTACYEVLWRDLHKLGHPAGSRLYKLYK
jgi:hypothetical protein